MDHALKQIFNSYQRYTEKQQRVLMAAVRLFARKGYANTSTLEIAALAGVSEGSIFRRFRNKENLLMAVIDPILNEILPHDLERFSNQDLTTTYRSLDEFVNRIVRDRIGSGEMWFPLMKTFLNEMLYTPQMRQRLMQAVPDDVISIIDSQLLDLKKRHLLVDWSNREIIRFLMVAIWGYMLQHFVLWADASWDRQLEERHLIEGLTRALTPP
jgi:AcrR family transcriptional regulator